MVFRNTATNAARVRGAQLDLINSRGWNEAGAFAYRQRVAGSSRRRNRESGGSSCPCTPEWTKWAQPGWTSRTAWPRWHPGVDHPHTGRPLGNWERWGSSSFRTTKERPTEARTPGNTDEFSNGDGRDRFTSRNRFNTTNTFKEQTWRLIKMRLVPNWRRRVRGIDDNKMIKISSGLLRCCLNNKLLKICPRILLHRGTRQ